MRKPALGLATALLVTGGCSTDSPGRDGGDSPADAVGHVHALGVDPADGTLYAATHTGVMRVADDGELTRVADRYQDTMAFTVIGPGHFLGSGHPDLQEDLPSHLGLIESTDAAETWEIRSLGGEADFHSLTASGGRTYGYNAIAGELLVSDDLTTWTRMAQGDVIDLAAEPDAPDTLVASVPDGTVHRFSGGGDAVQLTEAPPLLQLAWPSPDALLGVTATGEIFLSDDAGDTWTQVAEAPGTPAAFDATEKIWHVATEGGISASEDSGKTWRTILEIDH